MLTGVKFRAYPTGEQKQTLSQWMGCARVIWNAKCQDERYMTSFARKFCAIGTYAPINQSYSQYKNKSLTPYLYECPSQILRNAAVNWYQSYWKFIKKEAGKPRLKKKSAGGSIHLTRELFKFVRDDSGKLQLFIGTVRNNIGILSVKKHRDFQLPNSLYIKQKNGQWWVSFCYGEADVSSHQFNKDNLLHLRDASATYLENHVIGIDRGVAIPVQAGETAYQLTRGQHKKKVGHEKYIKRLQRQLAKKQKPSVRYKRTKNRLAKRHQKIAHIRHNFCHQTSQACVACDHRHPNNRKSQSVFHRERCGHTDNADRNAAMLIKKRAIQLFKDSGTELSKRGVLTPALDTGRGAKRQTSATTVSLAVGCEPSKKKRNAALSTVAA